MNLATADKYALQLVDTLGVYCDKIAIAGSIRRRRPAPNDIDLVVLTRDPTAVKVRCRQTCMVRTDGNSNFICQTTNGIQIDIFFAQYARSELFHKVPGTWGSILLCRTGSIAHNIYIVDRAKELGLTWNPYAGVLDHDYNIIASETEEEIFASLKLDFIPPEQRER